MKVLIVDDEPLARRRIADYLSRKYPAYVVQEAEDGFAALDAIRDRQPDLVFLDVEMPELSGFDVLLELEERNFRVIFQTAFNEFAVRAFDENAVDYLLKPFTDERLEQALKKASPADLQPLDRYLAQNSVYLNKIMIRVGNRLKAIDPTEVLCFTSESHSTRVFLKDIDYAYDHSLTFLESRLDPRLFLRTHRHSIVRLESIVSVKTGPNMFVTLSDGRQLPVSRERRQNLQKALGMRSN